MAPSTSCCLAFTVAIDAAEPGRSHAEPQGMRASLWRPSALQRRMPESTSEPNCGRSSTSKLMGWSTS
eukprot:12050536-Alexandrium_andersonii.AAC.1